MASGKRMLQLGRDLLYDPDDLTTHAVCFGMTGSGKTGLCLVLLEEVIRCGIPVFMIDPKGDLANLMLTFPGLSSAEFEPWIDPEQARAAGRSVAELAEATARRWREGLAASGLSSNDVRALRDGVEFALYTPGSTAATPLNVLGGFAPPAGLGPDAWEIDPEPLRARIAGTVAALLDLIEVDAEPVRSPEGIFLARLFELRWKEGQALSLESIIRELQDPSEPMRTLGAIDTETMLPGARRMRIALALNGLLASPSFSAWTKGEPLDVARMVRSAGGRGTGGAAGVPRACILHIAHLSDRERSFFVATFLQALITWMRAQPGTSSLRALFYMDEIFGYFPPQGNPPTKEPLLTLLKQGRAFGLGTVLATQNPVDVDYKGLANAGTWFLGKLQTEQDRARLLDGLSGSGSIDRASVEKALAGLPPRTFLLHNVHDPGLRTFAARWAMSYLRGPMTREEIRRLAAPVSPASPPVRAAAPPAGRAIREKAPAGVPEWFLPAPEGATLAPALRARARVTFEEASSGVREPREEDLRLPLAAGADAGGLAWEQATSLEEEPGIEPPGSSLFTDLPDAFRSAAAYRKAGASLKSHLALSRSLTLLVCAPLKLASRAGEAPDAFRRRCEEEADRRREAESQKLKAKYEEKLRRLQERAGKELRELERDKQEVQARSLDVVVSAGETILGIFTGRRRSITGAVGRGRMAASTKARADKSAAEYETARENLEMLEEEAARAIDEMKSRWSAAAADVTEHAVRPKRTGVEILEVGLLWAPAKSEK